MKHNGVTPRDPDYLEHEVQHLRDECTRLLDELEGRFQRMAGVPGAVRARYQRLRAAVVRIEQSVARLVREQPLAMLAGVLTAGAAVALLAIGVARRNRRPPSLVERVAGLLAP